MRGKALQSFPVVFRLVTQKVHKSSKASLTVLVLGDYNPLTNDGGGAAGDGKLRLRVSRKLVDITEYRSYVGDLGRP